MLRGFFGSKVGMTQRFADDRSVVPATVLSLGTWYVTQIKTLEKDGYEAVQVGYGERKEKHTTKPQLGHFQKAGTTPKKKLVEFEGFEMDLKLGDTIGVDIFEEGSWVDITGTSKGKGFQGVVKRHGFGGVGQSTHGQHNRLRAPGSIGAASYPARVFKGMRMAGRDGGKTVTVQDLEVLKVMPEKNLLVVKGSVPGAKGSYLIIEK